MLIHINKALKSTARIVVNKAIMQGKLFQRCMHLLYYSVQSLGGNVNTRRMSQPDMESIFLIQNQGIILVIRNYYVNYQNYQNYQNYMLLSSSDTPWLSTLYDQNCSTLQNCKQSYGSSSVPGIIIEQNGSPLRLCFLCTKSTYVKHSPTLFSKKTV